jgi:penicillin-binding protein 2
MRVVQTKYEREFEQKTSPVRRENELSVMRARIMSVVLLLAFSGLIARLWFLQIAHGDDYQKLAEANHTRLLREGAPRGMIEDSNGEILASNRSQFAIFAEPSVARDPATLSRLASILQQPVSAILLTLHNEKKNDYDAIRIALNVPIEIVSKVEELRPYLPGISTAPVPVRWYPYDGLMGNALGVLGRISPSEYKSLEGTGYFPDDFVGMTGIEAEYERYLHGQPGGRQLEIDAKGREVKQLGYQTPVPGDTLRLTIQSSVQKAAEDTFAAHNFVGGAVAVNPQTGAVIAIASAPSLNSNLFATGIAEPAWNSLVSNPNKPLLDRAVDSLYPPGSTFKQVTAAAGLQSGAITTSSTAYCTGTFMLGRARFHCWQRHGEVDFFRAMAVSCDVFFYGVGLKTGPERLSYYARQYPLAQKTGIDLPHEMIGSIPSPAWKVKHFGKLGPAYSTWYGGDTLNMSIGQGYVLTTPLQMALVTATTANGGDVLKPFIVQDAINPLTHQMFALHQRTVLRHIGISPDNIKAVQKAMLGTTTGGTGAIVNLPGVQIASKTGSAQVAGHKRTHGWFVAYAPFDHPTIACAAVVEEGGHGASSAGYIVRAMLQAYFHQRVDIGVKAGPSD